MLDSRHAAEQRAVKLDVLFQVIDRQMDMESFHIKLPISKYADKHMFNGKKPVSCLHVSMLGVSGLGCPVLDSKQLYPSIIAIYQQPTAAFELLPTTCKRSKSPAIEPLSSTAFSASCKIGRTQPGRLGLIR
jgi:hypothetical protein